MSSKPRQIPAPAVARGRSASTREAMQHLAPETTAPAPATVIPFADAYDPGDELAELERLLGDFGPVDGYVARIERVQRPGIEADLCGYLGSVPFSSELFDEVRTSFGGGRFRARICDSDGRYKRSFTFTIAGAPKRAGESVPAASVGVGPASAGERGNAQLERMVGELAASVASMAAAIQHAQHAPRNSEDELERSLKLIKAVKDAMPAPAAGNDSLSTLEAFFRIQDMIEERAPRGGGSGDNIGRIVEHGVKPIASLMSRSLDLQERALNQKQNGGGSLRRVANAQPAAPSAPATSMSIDETEAAGGPDELAAIDPVMMLAANIPAIARSYLANQAKNDRDPETYAIMVLDSIQESSPETYALLPELVTRADFLETLLAGVPQWAAYPEWFAELVAAMRAQLTDDDAGGADVADVAHGEEAA